MTDYVKMARTSRGRRGLSTTEAARAGASCSPGSGSFLVDRGSFTEGRRFANAPWRRAARGRVVTGTATIGGRPVAMWPRTHGQRRGSWGSPHRERSSGSSRGPTTPGLAMNLLVDSAGARITDQGTCSPAAAGGGADLRTQGPRVGSDPAGRRAVRGSAAGGAYIRRSATSPRWWTATPRCTWQPADGSRCVVSEEKNHPMEEMGGGRLHCTVSGSGHFLAC